MQLARLRCQEAAVRGRERQRVRLRKRTIAARDAHPQLGVGHRSDQQSQVPQALQTSRRLRPRCPAHHRTTSQLRGRRGASRAGSPRSLAEALPQAQAQHSSREETSAGRVVYLQASLRSSESSPNACAHEPETTLHVDRESREIWQWPVAPEWFSRRAALGLPRGQRSAAPASASS